VSRGLHVSPEELRRAADVLLAARDDARMSAICATGDRCGQFVISPVDDTLSRGALHVRRSGSRL